MIAIAISFFPKKKKNPIGHGEQKAILVRRLDFGSSMEQKARRTKILVMEIIIFMRFSFEVETLVFLIYLTYIYFLVDFFFFLGKQLLL